MNPAINKAKYENAILYFASMLEQLGSTKLAKLMYYLDFINYRDHGNSITGTKYYKQEYGPLAKDLVEVVGDLVGNNKLRVESYIHPKYKREAHRYVALSKPNLDVFSEEEQILLRKLANKYSALSTDEMVAKSHLEAPWQRAKEGGELDYNLSFDVEDFNEELEKEYEKEDKDTIAALTAALE